MPTYEYQCLTNAHRFEVKQSFSDAALTACQVCDEPVRKVFSAAGIVFKGSGYYVNDTRKPEKSANGSKDGESGGSTSKDSSSKDGSSKDGAGASKDSSSTTSSGTAKSSKSPATSSSSSAAKSE